jgi:hypothetical protein
MGKALQSSTKSLSNNPLQIGKKLKITTMRNLIIIGLSAWILLSSCENRKVYFEEISPTPTVVITNNSGTPIDRDSVKMTLKSRKTSSSYVLRVGGNKVQKDVTAKLIGGSGTFTSETKVSNGNTTFNFTPSSISTSLLVYEVKDNFGKLAEAKIEIVAFGNLAPVASFTVENKGVLGTLEKRINAESSFDRDVAYGGFIRSYVYNINGKDIETDKNFIDWVFASAGNYSISLTTIDSDGATSTISKLVKVD